MSEKTKIPFEKAAAAAEEFAANVVQHTRQENEKFLQQADVAPVEEVDYEEMKRRKEALFLTLLSRDCEIVFDNE